MDVPRLASFKPVTTCERDQRRYMATETYWTASVRDNWAAQAEIAQLMVRRRADLATMPS